MVCLSLVFVMQSKYKVSVSDILLKVTTVSVLSINNAEHIHEASLTLQVLDPTLVAAAMSDIRREGRSNNDY